ncbi:MAG: ATPase domain-containing protein [Halobacteria archaeon]
MASEEGNTRDDERARTGVEGFDDLCGGGLLRDHTYLAAGAAGCGKTLFALQFLYNGATKFDEPGVFLATEERPGRIRRNAKRFGWDFEALELKSKIAFLDGTSTRVGLPSTEKYVEVRGLDMDSLLDDLVRIQEEIGAVRAVVDSWSSLSYIYGDPAKARAEALRLAATLEALGMTALVTSEWSDENRVLLESFLVDGVILFYNSRKENFRTRSLEVYKMRGSDHSRKIHPFEITPRGIVVHAREEVYGEI